MDCKDEQIERECLHYRAKTNADRIREMTDEELAEFLVDFQLDCEECMNRYGICVLAENCKKYSLEWLQKGME